MKINNRLVGYLTLLVLFLTVTGLSLYTYFTRYHGWYTRSAYADNIGNLKLDNILKVYGIEVGKIINISRDRGKARVDIKMHKSIQIHQDYKLYNLDIGLMGDRALFLYPGSKGSVLPDSAPLFADFKTGIAEGIRNADTLIFIVKDLKNLINRYARVDSGNDSLFTTKFKSVLTHLDRSSLRLHQTLADNEDKINRFIGKANIYSAKAGKRIKSFRPAVQTQLIKTEELALNAVQIIEKLEPLIDDLTQLIDSIEKGDHLIGKVINDKKFYPKLLNTVQKINKLLKTIKDDGISIDVDIF